MRPGGITDLAGFLTGAWRIDRRIADRRSGRTGRLTGTAQYRPQPGGLHYAEAGEMVFGDYRGPASQAYTLWLRSPASADLHFTDGRLFHVLDLSSGRADVSHACASDAYQGRYRVLGPDRWSVAWLVRGPRKALQLTTRYTRP